MTKACAMPLHASFKIGKIAVRIGNFATVESWTGKCRMFKFFVSPLISIWQSQRECQRSEERLQKKGSGNSLPHFLMTPASGSQAADIISNSKADGKFHPVINSHHFFLKNLWFASTAAWLISSTQRIGFKPQWGTSTWRRTVVETWGDRVLCLQNTSHDLYMWPRQFLSKTCGKQEMRRVQRLKRLQQLRLQGDEWEECDPKDAAAFLNGLIYTSGRSEILLPLSSDPHDWINWI